MSRYSPTVLPRHATGPDPVAEITNAIAGFVSMRRQQEADRRQRDVDARATEAHGWAREEHQEAGVDRTRRRAREDVQLGREDETWNRSIARGTAEDLDLGIARGNAPTDPANPGRYQDLGGGRYRDTASTPTAIADRKNRERQASAFGALSGMDPKVYGSQVEGMDYVEELAAVLKDGRSQAGERQKAASQMQLERLRQDRADGRTRMTIQNRPGPQERGRLTEDQALKQVRELYGKRDEWGEIVGFSIPEDEIVRRARILRAGGDLPPPGPAPAEPPAPPPRPSTWSRVKDFFSERPDTSAARPSRSAPSQARPQSPRQQPAAPPDTTELDAIVDVFRDQLILEQDLRAVLEEEGMSAAEIDYIISARRR